MPKKKQRQAPCPVIHPLPENSRPRLIDQGELHNLASDGGFQERYGKGKTPHTIHVWWARRPFSAMRTLVFASLCTEQTRQSNGLAGQLGQSAVPQAWAVKQARAFLAREYNDPPRVLDMFGGGGTIAMEAASLGAEAFSVDANPLAVFVQKSLLGLSGGGRQGFLSMVRDSGVRALGRLKNETEPLFPLRYSEKGPALAYLHTYSLKCEHCGKHFFLTKRPWLSRKNGRETALQEGPAGQTVAAVPRDYKFSTVWQKGGAVCPFCHTLHKQPQVSRCRDVLAAIARQGNGKGKEFEPVPPNAFPESDLMERMEQAVLNDLGITLPKSRLPRWSGIVNPALYGMETHADFLNPRQRLVLLLLIKILKAEYKTLRESCSEDTAQGVISLLSGLIDQLIDWNCRLSMWIPQNEQVGRAFCGPGVAMLWDYAEIDPLAKSPGNLWKKLDRIVEGAGAIPDFPHKPDVRLACAQQLPYEDGFFDAIVTDPPYYDNIFYSPLADFFYAWKKPLINLLTPDLAQYSTTESGSELVASVQRSENKIMAHKNYCGQLTQALCEGARVLKESGILSLVYSHGSLNGWDALVKAFQASPFLITSVQPLCIERKARPRGMANGAVNTCLVFVARKSPDPKTAQDFSVIIDRLKNFAGSKFARELLVNGWSREDAGMALFAQGAAMLANTAESQADDDLKALIDLESMVSAYFPSFKISKRKSL